jgi:prolyl-tRNA editing enzyme YbaK/EbsC (Cys-tRNA(Pro) deacylase)
VAPRDMSVALALTLRPVRTWPESVERVSEFLRGAGGEARLEEFAADAKTAEGAAEAIGCGLDQIVKSLVLVADGRAVVALVPGDRRADPSKVARAVGATAARIATADEVRAATGFAPGAVAPFPLPGVARIVAEQTFLSQPVVWAGAGSPRHMVRLTPAELLRLTRGDPADLVQDAYDSRDTPETKEP